MTRPDYDETAVSDGRTIEGLAGFYRSLTSRQRAGIEAVGMDMWEPYVSATEMELPLADRLCAVPINLSAPGMGVGISFETAPDIMKFQCVEGMGGPFWEAHVSGGEGVQIEGGAEVSPDGQTIVAQGGIGIGVGIPIGGNISRTNTFFAKSTSEKCPCTHCWLNPCQYLPSPFQEGCYFSQASANYLSTLISQLSSWAQGTSK